MELHPRYVRRDLVRRRFHGGIRLFAGFLHKDRPDDDLSDLVCSDYAAVWLLRGGGIYSDDAGTVVLRPGDLVQRLPGRRHTTRADDARTWVEFFIDVDAPFMAGLAACGAAEPAPVLHPGLDAGLLQRCDRFLDRLRRAGHDEGGAMLAAAHALLAELLTRARRPPATDRSAGAVAAATALLDRDLDRPMSMPAVARRVGLGYEHFRKAFAARVHCSPAAYRLRRRMELACDLLQQRRGDGLAAIAAAVGYGDPFAFAKAFRRQVGVSPGRFRARPTV